MPHTEEAPGPAIATTGLSRSFGEVVALRGVDLTVRIGEMFGLVGPDGSGKSTFIRMLCGILTPDSGTGSILGRDIVRERPALKREIGYLSQKFTLYGDLSVDENIEFFELHRVSITAISGDALFSPAPHRSRYLAERLRRDKQTGAVCC